MKTSLLPGLLLRSFILVLSLPACQKETPKSTTATTSSEVNERANGNAAVYPPSAKPYGLSYGDWSAIWWQKFLVFDCANNPFLNPENVLFHQSGQVYFLAGLAQSGTSVDVSIPHGKAILFPLINYINDYPCPDITFQPGPNQSLEEFLTEGAESAMADVTNLSVTIDGKPVNNPESYLFISDLFYFTGNPDLTNCIDACVTGSSQPAVAGGFFMMLKPLSKGVHTVNYHSEIPIYAIVQDGTFNITVQ